jgi:hypothetical protein
MRAEGLCQLKGRVIAIENLPTVEELDTFLRNQEVATVINIFELAQSIRALIESKAEVK